jgi:3-mercaptopyruvate sulfurtransferase SseA
MNHGFRRVRPLHGGLDAWIAAGYAVEEVLPPEAAPALQGDPGAATEPVPRKVNPA